MYTDNSDQKQIFYVNLTLLVIIVLLMIFGNLGCANNAGNVPKDIYVHQDPIKVDVTLSGDIVIKVLQTIAADPALQATIQQACNKDAKCASDTANNIIGSITSALGQQSQNNNK